MAETEYDADVVIAGAGPVGTWLAMELCAAGVSTLVLKARPERAPWSRGFAVQPRTLELFDSRHMSAALLPAGRRVSSSHFAMGRTRLDYTGLPTIAVLLEPVFARAAASRSVGVISVALPSARTVAPSLYVTTGISGFR